MGAILDLLITLAGFSILLGIPAVYAVAQVRVLRRWRGPMRAAAALPTPVWLAWFVTFVADVAQDPTSHNLFPFEILLIALASSTWLGLLTVAGRLTATCSAR